MFPFLDFFLFRRKAVLSLDKFIQILLSARNFINEFSWKFKSVLLLYKHTFYFIIPTERRIRQKNRKIYRLRKFPQLFCQDDYFLLTPEMLLYMKKKYKIWSESYFIKSYQNMIWSLKKMKIVFIYHLMYRIFILNTLYIYFSLLCTSNKIYKKYFTDSLM